MSYPPDDPNDYIDPDYEDELNVPPSEQQYGEYPEAWQEDYYDEHNFEYDEGE